MSNQQSSFELHLENLPRTIEVVSNGGQVGASGVPMLRLIDQRLLPSELVYIETSDWRTVIDAIKTLAVRGAPAIGIAGAAAVMLRAWEFVAASGPASTEGQQKPQLAGSTPNDATPNADPHSGLDCLMCQRHSDTACEGVEQTDPCTQALDTHRTFVLDVEAFDPELYLTSLEFAGNLIAHARPTAVNLAWAVDQTLNQARALLAHGATPLAIAEALYEFVVDLAEKDEQANRTLGAWGATLLDPESSVLTHCNAGSLATSFYGTALGVIYAAAAQGKITRVYADETRPVGQGARLTVWELAQAGVPVTLLCDSMAASAMAAGNVDAVVVGADRITAQGDVANKIGTLGVAILARHFGIPFYVAAPVSTIDGSLEEGSAIPIEMRSAEEVLPNPIEGVEVWNPSFDVTPAELITAIVTERGIFAPESIADALVASAACGSGE